MPLKVRELNGPVGTRMAGMRTKRAFGGAWPTDRVAKEADIGGAKIQEGKTVCARS